MAVALSVNLNKIALIRNSREGDFPSVVEFGRLALQAGADGLTVHPRPDQRHIRPHDVADLADLVKNHGTSEFNIEGNPFSRARGTYPGFIALVEGVAPHQCTLVPDTTTQLTSDHGFDLHQDGEALAPLIEQLHRRGIRVSLFMDPYLEQIALAKQVGADRIELYTGPYAEAFLNNNANLDHLFDQYATAAQHATELGLGVNAGHDLNLDNLPRFGKIAGLLEVSIGHALTVDALKMGFEAAVKAYKSLCLAQ